MLQTRYENYIEDHPTYLSDYGLFSYSMGAIIDPGKKQMLLPFIKENFGKLSDREMARKLGIGKTAVNRWCKELGLQHIKHSANENYFSKWSPEMAYILGIVFSDGNISWNVKKSYNALTITAAEKDKDHLEKIRLKLESTKPLLYSTQTESYRLIINSKKICQILMKFGVVPNKSLIVKFPKVPKKYLKDFIRGIIDGDGTVRYVNRKKSPYFEITVSSGSKNFLESLVKEISTIGVLTKLRKSQGNTYIAQYSCQRGLKLASWIYKDADLYLSRKYEQFAVVQDARGGDMS